MKSLSQMTEEELKTLCKSLESRYVENSTVTIKQSDFNEMWASIDRYAEENNRLQEQLKEAREVVKFYAETTVGHKQKDGTYGMWICSGEVAWENPLDRIKSRMNYICYDPRPAKKWLKKWKV